MQTLEHGLAMIHIVFRLTKGEIHDVDGIHLAHLLALGEDIHTIELVVFVFLIGLALQKAHDGELLVQERSHQTFEHGMVCLVAQQAFHRPIKAN